MNNLDGHKGKKPTKIELEQKVLELQSIVNTIIPEEKKQEILEAQLNALKEERARSLMMGFEVANQMLIDYADGHSFEEVVDFCKKDIEQKSVMESMVSGVKVADEYDKAIEEFKEKV